MQILKHEAGKSISINGASIYYEEAGNPSGIPILMLHGGFGTLEDFEPVISNFLSAFRIIAMDGRGQGKSTLGDQPLTYKIMQDDAVGLLDHLKISQVIVMGFSDGGMVAHRMAIATPERVRKLVSIAAPWRKEDLDLIRGFLLKVTPESWKEKFPESYQRYASLNPGIDFKILAMPAFQRNAELAYNYNDTRWDYMSIDTRITGGIMFFTNMPDVKDSIVSYLLNTVHPGFGPKQIDRGKNLRVRNVIITIDPTHDVVKQYWKLTDGNEWLAVVYDYVKRK